MSKTNTPTGGKTGGTRPTEGGDTFRLTTTEPDDPGPWRMIEVSYYGKFYIGGVASRSPTPPHAYRWTRKKMWCQGPPGMLYGALRDHFNSMGVTQFGIIQPKRSEPASLRNKIKGELRDAEREDFR